jgi:hypothetical protein
MALIVLSTACKKGGDEPKPVPAPDKDKPVEVINGKFSGKVDEASFETPEVAVLPIIMKTKSLYYTENGNESLLDHPVGRATYKPVFG